GPRIGPFDDFPHHEAHDPYDEDLAAEGHYQPLEDWQAEVAAEEALRSTAEPPQSELLSFYDRLRRRILATVERRAGKLSADAVRALLLVPDVFMLLVRLTLDKEVPGSTRAMIGGALAYFVLPIDLLPEAILGPVGFLDDLVLAVAVLSQPFSAHLPSPGRRGRARALAPQARERPGGPPPRAPRHQPPRGAPARPQALRPPPPPPRPARDRPEVGLKRPGRSTGSEAHGTRRRERP